MKQLFNKTFTFHLQLNSLSLDKERVRESLIIPFFTFNLAILLLFTLIGCESTGSAIISSKTTNPSKPVSISPTPAQNKQNVLPASSSTSVVPTPNSTPSASSTPATSSSQSPVISPTPIPTSTPTPTPTSSQSLPPIPNAPGGLSKTSISTGGFTVNWNQVTDATKYNVYKDGIKIGSDITSAYYNVSGLTPNTTYNITVTAVNSGGESNHSSTLTVTTLTEAPTDLAKNSVTLTSFTLTWSAVTNATSYKVYKDGALYAENVTGTSKEITGLASNTTYSMQVSAVNASGESNKSSSLSVITLPPAPAGLTKSNVNATSFTLTWNAVTGTTYKVYKDGALYTENVTETSKEITGLSASTTYSMQVSAVNASGESTKSSSSSVTTAIIDAPTGLNSSNITANSFTLKWNAVTNATSYNVYKGVTNIATVSAPTTTYDVTLLDANTPYNMAVKAVNANGESVGAEIEVTTNKP